MQLDAVPASARRARDILRTLLADEGISTRRLDTALLLTSELIVNAVLHGQGGITLDVALDDHLLRVAVVDAGPGDPTVRRSDEQLIERGRGLMLVEDLATRWGVERTGDGAKTVWFHLAYMTPIE